MKLVNRHLMYDGLFPTTNHLVTAVSLDTLCGLMLDGHAVRDLSLFKNYVDESRDFCVQEAALKSILRLGHESEEAVLFMVEYALQSHPSRLEEKVLLWLSAVPRPLIDTYFKAVKSQSGIVEKLWLQMMTGGSSRSTLVKLSSIRLYNRIFNFGTRVNRARITSKATFKTKSKTKDRERDAVKSREQKEPKPQSENKPEPKASKRRATPWVSPHPSDRNRIYIKRNLDTWKWGLQTLEVKEEGGVRPLAARPEKIMKLTLKIGGNSCYLGCQAVWEKMPAWSNTPVATVVAVAATSAPAEPQAEEAAGKPGAVT